MQLTFLHPVSIFWQWVWRGRGIRGDHRAKCSFMFRKVSGISLHLHPRPWNREFKKQPLWGCCLFWLSGFFNDWLAGKKNHWAPSRHRSLPFTHLQPRNPWLQKGTEAKRGLRRPWKELQEKKRKKEKKKKKRTNWSRFDEDNDGKEGKKKRIKQDGFISTNGFCPQRVFSCSTF